MKFEVKVGKDLEGEIAFSLICDAKPPKEPFSFKKAATFVLIAVMASVVVSSVAYGMATGDFSAVKSLADTGKDAITFAIKLAMKSLE